MTNYFMDDIVFYITPSVNTCHDCRQSAKMRHFKTEHFGLIRGDEEAL